MYDLHCTNFQESHNFSAVLAVIEAYRKVHKSLKKYGKY